MNESSVQILILSHGDFCESALRTAALLGADADGVRALPLCENTSMEAYALDVADAVAALPEGSLVFLDLFGGTPFNTVARLIAEHPVFAIAGFNLPMLVEAMSSRDEYCGQELVDAVLAAGQAGVRDVNRFLAGLNKNR